MTLFQNRKKWVFAGFLIALVVLLLVWMSFRKKSLEVNAGSYLLSPNGSYCFGIQTTPPLLHLVNLQTMHEQKVGLVQIDPVNVTWAGNSQSVWTTKYSSTDKTTAFLLADVFAGSGQKEVFRLSGNQAIDLSMSPDGKILGFFNFLDKKQMCVYDTLTHSLNSVPGYSRRSGGNELTWSADGKKVIFAARNQAHKEGLVLYDTLGKKTKFFPYTCDSFAISPDGQSFAAVRLTSYPKPRATVTIVRTSDGRLLHSLDLLVSVAGRIVWNRNGQAIYYVSHWLEKAPQIESLNATSGQQKTLLVPSGPSTVGLIGIAGSTLYYTTATDVSHSQLSRLPL